MSLRAFIAYLAGVSLLAAALVGALLLGLPAAQEHGAFSVGMTLFFVLFCVVLFGAGTRAAASTNKYAFIQLVMAAVFGKMLVSLGVLALYRQLAQPTNALFVGIFLLLYVLYTIFEVWFMTRLART